MLSACEVYVLGIGALVRLLRGAAGAVGEVNYLFACGLVTRPHMSCCGYQVEPKGSILVETAGFSTILSCLVLDS